MSKVLVLGGAGFIGSNLVPRLLESGFDVRIFTRPSRSSIGRLKKNIDQLEIFYGDFSDEYAIKQAVKNIDIVFHLITTTFPSTTLYSGIYDVQSNLIPTIRLLESSLDAGVKKVIYASSGGTVYGEPKEIPITESHPLAPKSIYGHSKKIIESYMTFFSENSGLSIDILRISNPYGPGQSFYGAQGLISVAIGNLLDKKPLKIIGDGSAVRDYIYIKDIVDALVQCTKLDNGNTVNVSAGKGLSIMDVVAALEEISGESFVLQNSPARQGDVEVNILSNILAKQVLGWEPHTPFKEGLQLTWDWAQLQNK